MSDKFTHIAFHCGHTRSKCHVVVSQHTVQGPSGGSRQRRHGEPVYVAFRHVSAGFPSNLSLPICYVEHVFASEADANEQTRRYLAGYIETRMNAPSATVKALCHGNLLSFHWSYQPQDEIEIDCLACTDVVSVED